MDTRRRNVANGNHTEQPRQHRGRTWREREDIGSYKHLRATNFLLGKLLVIVKRHHSK